MNELAFRGACELVAALARRKVSSRELLELYLDRIEKLDPMVNAVVTLDAENALRAATAADEALARGNWFGPLHGLPMTIKDAIETAGMRTTSGHPDLAGHVPSADAPAVARLRAAGAIVFGKTNLPTLAFDGQSFNDLFGTTNNPWDFSRTPGGSSGGAAAALAAGLTGLELGSDLAGSVRGPAHLCGVFGHKPSQGLVPIRGHIPPLPTDNLRDYDLVVLGPVGRSAADVALALDVLAGPDDDHAVAWRLQLPPPRHEKLRDYRVATWFEDPRCPVDDDVRACLDQAVATLLAEGVTVTELAQAPKTLSEHDRLAQRLIQGEICDAVPDEQYAALLEVAAEADPADTSEHVRWARDVTARKREWNAADAERNRLRRRWAALFADHDALLTPVMPIAAFPHDHRPVERRHIFVNGRRRPYWDQNLWAHLANVSYLPATVAPIGFTAGGLPVGIQIIGPYLEDRTPLALAGYFEKILGGFRSPPAFHQRRYACLRSRSTLERKFERTPDRKTSVDRIDRKKSSP